MAIEDSSKYGYQYGAAAPQYPYDIPQPTRQPEYEPLKRPTKRVKTRVDKVYVAKMSMCCASVFVAALAFVGLTAQLAKQQQYLTRLTKDIREVQSAINSTKAVIAAGVDLETVQKVAKESLGMAEPLAHQVVYLELPQESYTSYHE